MISSPALAAYQNVADTDALLLAATYTREPATERPLTFEPASNKLNFNAFRYSEPSFSSAKCNNVPKAYVEDVDFETSDNLKKILHTWD